MRFRCMLIKFSSCVEMLGEMKNGAYYSMSVPSLTATSSYSLRLGAMSSGQPRQVSWDAATRDASVSPAQDIRISIHKPNNLCGA